MGDTTQPGRTVHLDGGSRADAERHARAEWEEDGAEPFDKLSAVMQHAMIERAGRIIRRIAAAQDAITTPDEEKPKAS